MPTVMPVPTRRPKYPPSIVSRLVAQGRYMRPKPATHGEFGWILEDNKGMLSIAQLPSAKVNHRYRIYDKVL